MEKQPMDGMQLDKRLLERPGWITSEELERELSALPDVADKIDPREDDPSGEFDEPNAPSEPQTSSSFGAAGESQGAPAGESSVPSRTSPSEGTDGSGSDGASGGGGFSSNL